MTSGARGCAFALLFSMAIACGPSSSSSDGGTADAARADSGAIDAGVPMLDASVLADAGPRTTRIRILYPAGETITLRGSGGPLSWDVGLEASAVADGVYELSTTEIVSALEWKPLLDDSTWARGPNYHVEPGQTIEVAPHFEATSGHVVSLDDFTSEALGNTRPVFAYLPASYDENTAVAYPVVYMHDGQNLFDAALAFGGNEWEVDETFDRAAEEGRCPDESPCQADSDCGGARCETFREAIVIGVGNTASRIYEYTPTVDDSVGDGGGADLYLRALVEELKPTIDSSMRTHTEANETGILGSSLGGLVSSYGGITHADTFGLVGAMSPSTWWDDRTILGTVATIPSRPTRALRVYVDSGDSGPSNDGVTDTADLAAAYETAGYTEGDDLDYLVAPGHQHNELYWRIRLPGALAFLLGPRERVIH